jgi:hypothetical protein
MVFDMADPGVKKMVEGWADNTEYEATVVIKTGAGPQRNVAEVTSFEPETAEETPSTDTEPEEEAAGMPVAEEEAATEKPTGKVPPIKYK